jgi:L-ascorbate metabolism protein UlaG (beta-lactamase superfamily)
MTAMHTITLGGSPSPMDSAVGSVHFIGTATTIIRCGGFTILTDPNFIHRHEKVDIGYGMSATRQTDPAIEIDELPPIDLVVLSHFHGDHFDQVAERQLNPAVPIVTTAEAARELEKRDFMNCYALDTWGQATVLKGDARLQITATPGRHAPPLVNWALPDVMGSILEFGAGPELASPRMYITGDTLLIDELAEIPRRYPDIDLALLHLGGTRVMGLLVTMDAEQGVQALHLIQPRVAIPIHYNDYDVFESPLSDFQAAVAAAGLQGRVHYLAHGERYEFPAPNEARRVA